MGKDMINRLKIVLAQKHKSSKWLAKRKDSATVSKWVTNTCSLMQETSYVLQRL